MGSPADSEYGDAEKGADIEKTPSRGSQVSTEEVEVRGFKRSRWFRMPFVPVNPPPPKTSIDDAELLPETTAGWFSLVTFSWITPLLALGYARPLEAPDLYRLQDSRPAALIAAKINASFDARRRAADAYNARLAAGAVSPGWRTLWWTLRGKRAERERRWREHDGRVRPSLTLAINDSVKYWFWSGGVMKVSGDVATILTPLVVKALINFATNSYSAYKEGRTDEAPPIGTGIGLAFALLFMQLFSSLCQHHFFYRSTSTGVLVRGGLITAIYARALRLTSRARTTLTNGKLVNHISTDVSRVDFCCGFFHLAWIAPVQMAVCLVLLLVNLGPSALAGFAFFVLCTPVQTRVMRRLMGLRQKSMAWTDRRAKLLQELLGGMKIIKYFAWEVPYLRRIGEFRTKELRYIRSLLMIRSANNAVAISLPVLASVLSFVVYSLSGHTLDAANIFASLTLFQLLRLPLMFLPLSFSAIADAQNAVGRLYDVFDAETLSDTKEQDPDMDVAIRVEHGDFTWDAPPAEAAKKKGKKDKGAPPSTVTAAGGGAPEVFTLKDINMAIPRGQLTAIVGPVGTGKSSLLEALIGEMRRTRGAVRFNGSVAYCPQSAWIQNATVRENITFGRPFEPERYWRAVRDACLEADIDMMPNGDLTEVGERGISLSGGQKQRINICRAIYVDADIQIFDDPLSALDAHVGRAVFANVFTHAGAGKTRVLVTHALHLLPQVDYVYTVVDGRVAERGTYAALLARDGAFARFVREFGAREEQDEKEKEAEEEAVEEAPQDEKRAEKKGAGSPLMQAEERNTGAVSGMVYKEYLKAGRGKIIIPLLVLSLAFLQGAQVMSSYWLVYWQEKKWSQSPGFYMGIYAGLGISQAIGFFLMGLMFSFLTFYASRGLHKVSIERVMHAPMSFFETTPLGRIMNRFSKDIDTIDNMLGDSLRMFFSTLSNILGAIILIAIVLPWFLIAVFSISALYLWAAMFYRASARELKRLDAILRSSLYSHFSESLSGLTTIRAYGEQERFLDENKKRVDVENRAYWLTVTNQRWLGIRLDFLGILLTFVVAILTVGTRFHISPSQTGVTLSYIISVQQAFGWMVRQSAEVENNMNSVERVIHYANALAQEPPHALPAARPPAPWPAKGAVEMTGVVLRYRPELPDVLRGLTMAIRPGEKIGIVGRTGAGKSSIMTALYRLVELTAGSIVIDGVDISTVGLTDLRRGLAIIPQDPLLFSGTLRSNLDPFGEHDDARLWDALKRAYLVEDRRMPAVDLPDEDATLAGQRTPAGRFALDSAIEDEGSNLSVGQRSLVSLARALVLDARILILDEATASVDYETDKKIQDTIATEFRDRTILCIAHRLRTIIGYDRICVMDAGTIAEFDTPENLYKQHDGIFRGMCERSSIALEDIVFAAKANRH
ncbi:ABC transporter [Phanerochaete sordida]|uniref:ABC transporter n=1 Tax=Phanerochaete sordida TaxID=48140 RepID=A0A9P3GKI1_9APHY|nr:ABC transporter [Phanerochaete sordida]